MPVVLQRLVQQHLLGLALVPGAAGAGRAGGHAEGGAGGAAEIRSSRSCGNGDESSAVPADPNACRFAGLSGTRISDPSIEPTSRSPTVTAR